MSGLQKISLKKLQFETELKQFENLLNRHKSLGEKDKIQPFFKKKKVLSALIGNFNQSMHKPEYVGFEVELWGKRYCDMVIGCKKSGKLTFIEFEDATPSSLFKTKKKNNSNRDWSNRLEHGVSQISDWFCLLNIFRDNLKLHFDFEIEDYSGMVIIGRDTGFASEEERRRLQWRSQKMLMDSRVITIITYDELLRTLQLRNNIWQSNE